MKIQVDRLIGYGIKCRRINIVIGLLLYALSGFAQTQQIKFNHFLVDQGLSQSSVLCIEEDSLNRIWFGTRNGLNCFDGVSNKVYNSLPGDSTSLLGHYVLELLVDGQHLWVLTRKGISRLDFKTSRFEQYPVKASTIVKYQNKILLGTNKGIAELDWDKKMHSYQKEFSKLLPVINELLVLQDGALLASMRLSKKSEVNLVKYKSGTKIEIANGIKISHFFQDRIGNIWVGTIDGGIYAYDENLDEIAHYNVDNGLCSNVVYEISQDNQGKIWIGTLNGLSILNPENGAIQNYTANSKNIYSLSHDAIFSILFDSNNNAWVGTYYGGVNYCNLKADVYYHYSTQLEGTYRLSNDMVTQMVEDNNHKIWAGTEGGGINIIDKTNNKVKYFTKKDGLSGNNIQSIYFDGEETMYIGTHNDGFNVVNILTNKVQRFVNDINDPNTIQSNVISCIVPYQDGLLLGTNSGVLFFNIEDQTFAPFLDERYGRFNQTIIYSILIDEAGDVWIGTINDLLRYNPTLQTIVSYSSQEEGQLLNENIVFSIREDHNNNIWVGTFGSGLVKINKTDESCISFTSENSTLQSNFIYEIKESKDGQIWVSTISGLSVYNKTDELFYNHQRDEGFPLKELNKRALLLDDQRIFVGGINGIISFKEDEFFAESRKAKLLFSSIDVNNQPIQAGDKTGILSQAMVFTDRIILQPEHKTLKINYTTCHYVDDLKSNYRIKLEGFNKEWLDYGEQTSVTFTNLDAGTYKLRIQAVSPITQKVLTEKDLEIKVIAPVYQRWYAIVFYVFTILVILYWFMRNRFDKLNLSHQLSVEKLNRENEANLTKTKLLFFTNISHEFRTPLTLITGFVEKIFEEKGLPKKIEKSLRTVYMNSQKLNDLVNELLDFRKLEQGHLKLKVSEVNIHQFVKDQIYYFEEYFKREDIEYSSFVQDDIETIWMDRNQMGKVINNLINNSIKYLDKSPAQVNVRVLEDDKCFTISIEDNGCGISESDLKNIFNRFFQGDNSIKREGFSGSSGIGLAYSKGIVDAHHGQLLAESKEGQGSTFSIRLLKGKEHFAEEQILNDLVIDDRADEPSVIKEKDNKLRFTEESVVNNENDNKMHLLIVEDNADVRLMISALFEDLYHITEAIDGQEGMKLALEKQPDIIISDVMMPNQSGTEMCAKLKRNIETSHIPIILLTAKTSFENKLEGIELGADDYVSKPFSSRMLKARVKNLLQNRIVLQNRYKSEPKLDVSEIAKNKLDLEWMKKLESVIESNIDNEKFDVDYFASEMNISRSNLYRKVKAITGQTPNDFVQSFRIKKAASLLTADPSLNVTDVAYAMGFSSAKYFSQCFRNVYGIPPSKYGKSGN
ncbi:MAG: response regulator [Carboxylicivirga sp.]|nr:response regulator [Carboxylicivirga sp.]